MTDERAALVLYVRAGCHLCDQFLIELSLELGGVVDGLRVVDVDGAPALAARFGLRVPVLAVGSTVAGEGFFDRGRFRGLYPV